MKVKTIVAMLASIGMTATASAAVLDLGTLVDGFTPGYFQYGNAHVYSLPVNNYVHNLLLGGGTGPGSPYYVGSTPGAIKDTVVIYTGASGTGVDTNVAGFDNAYLTPSGSKAEFASMGGPVVAGNLTGPTNMVAPTLKAGINLNLATSWEANVSDLLSFLDGGKATFMFNNNDTNTDQNLALWAKLWITDAAGTLYGRALYVDNVNLASAPQQYGLGGVPAGGGALAYNGGAKDQPRLNDDGTTDYVKSGGDVCIDDTAGGPGVPAIVDCSNPASDKTINHNLGANEVAYAAQFPLLQQYLSELAASAAGYTFHLDLWLGCDVRWGPNGCADRKIDNGFEQLWLVSEGKTDIPAPEPGMLALMGLGLLGVAATRNRRGKASA